MGDGLGVEVCGLGSEVFVRLRGFVMYLVISLEVVILVVCLRVRLSIRYLVLELW